MCFYLCVFIYDTICMYVFVYLCMHVVYLVYMDMHPCSYSLAKFNEGMKNTNNIPRTFDQFEHVTETSTESALKVLIMLPYSSIFPQSNIWLFL